jgi:hypothetical protein
VTLPASTSTPTSTPTIDPLERVDLARLRAALKLQAAAGGPAMTKLCALRAHLRGRMHFSPTTDLALRRWVDGVPVVMRQDRAAPGGWAYDPITPAVVAAWVADLARELAAAR